MLTKILTMEVIQLQLRFSSLKKMQSALNMTVMDSPTLLSQKTVTCPE